MPPFCIRGCAYTAGKAPPPQIGADYAKQSFYALPQDQAGNDSADEKEGNYTNTAEESAASSTFQTVVEREGDE
jgi:hypothetical protein